MKNKKFNVIDVLIVLALVAAVGFAAVKFMPKAPADPTEVTVAEDDVVNFRFTVRADNVPEDLANSISASLANDADDGLYRQIYNSDKLQTARVTGWTMVETEDEGYTMHFTIDAHERITGVENHTVGTQEIRLGKNYLLKTLGVEISTITVAMENVDE